MGLIYPTLELPKLKTPAQEEVSFKKSVPRFDNVSGEFEIDKAGRVIMATPQETFELWVLKVCATERNTRLAYSDKIGVEMRDIAQIKNPSAVRSRIIRTLTEAVSVHPLTEAVRDFRFKNVADRIYVTFSVQTKQWRSEIAIEL